MKIYLDSVGCRLNQSEIEKYAIEFRSFGHTLVSKAEEADIAVVNTCTVTAAAASDSRQKLRKILRDNQIKVVSTGCLTAIEPNLFDSEGLSPVIIPNYQKNDLVRLVLDNLEQPVHLGRIPVPGGRTRTRAFIKAQDGCNNFCTFCITRIARGKAVSIPSEIVVNDIKDALEGGVKEVVLTGVHLGSWGCDLPSGSGLSELVEAICSIPGDFRIRLSSLEPWDLTTDLFSLWLKDERLCRHFHLPLQSGSLTTLRHMARNTTPEKFSRLVDGIRSMLSNVTLSTDVIVGFPGETDEAFNESMDFVRKIRFDGGHVFTYSPREGTPAAKYPEQITQTVKKERSSAMRQALAKSGYENRGKYVGNTYPVLWEGMRKNSDGIWRVAGLTENNLRVVSQVMRSVTNQVLMTKLTKVTEDGFEGEINKQ